MKKYMKGMILQDNKKQILLLYEDVYDCSLQISAAIENEWYDDVIDFVEKRKKIISDIMNMQKSPDFSASSELESLSVKIKENEKKNLEKLKEYKILLKDEILQLKQQDKFLKAYSIAKESTGELLTYYE